MDSETVSDFVSSIIVSGKDQEEIDDKFQKLVNCAVGLGISIKVRDVEVDV